MKGKSLRNWRSNQCQLAKLYHTPILNSVCWHATDVIFLKLHKYPLLIITLLSLSFSILKVCGTPVSRLKNQLYKAKSTRSIQHRWFLDPHITNCMYTFKCQGSKVKTLIISSVFVKWLLIFGPPLEPVVPPFKFLSYDIWLDRMSLGS